MAFFSKSGSLECHTPVRPVLWPVLIACVAVASRTLFLVFLDTAPTLSKYTSFAWVSAHGDIAERTLDISPFYLWFFRTSYVSLHLSIDTIKIIQAAVGVASCLLILAIGRRMFAPGAALCAALFYALYGNGLVLETELEPTAFEIFFGLCCLYFLVVAKHAPGKRAWIWMAASGLCCGLGIITKPNLILFLPFALAWIAWNKNPQATTRRKAALALALLLATSLPVGAVTLHNYLKFNDFILVTADWGKVFFHGNALEATAFSTQNLPVEYLMGTVSLRPDMEHVIFRQTARDLSQKHLSPSQTAWFWTRLTLDDIRSRPLSRYLALEADKLRVFFLGYEIHQTSGEYINYQNVSPYPFVRFGLISCLGLLGMVLCARRFCELLPCFGMVAAYLASGLVFFVCSRYRAPAVPCLCLFAGHAVFALTRMASAKKILATGACLAFLATAALVSAFSFEKQIHAYEKRINQFNWLPDFVQSQVNKGEAYENAGQLRLALACYQAALMAFPGQPTARAQEKILLAKLCPQPEPAMEPPDPDFKKALYNVQARYGLRKAFASAVRFWQARGFDAVADASSLRAFGLKTNGPVRFTVQNGSFDGFLISARHAQGSRTYSMDRWARIHVCDLPVNNPMQ